MAELTTDPRTTTATSSCCSADAQTTCCAPSEKAACCGESAAGGSCSCSAGQGAEPGGPPDVREIVRERYAEAARAVTAADPASCGCTTLSTTDEHGAEVFGAALYGASESEGVGASAVAASLGCGVPTAVAELHAGETVLDLGCGAGADVLISARRVGPTGRVIGLDMTDEMLELARANAVQAAVRNVELAAGFDEIEIRETDPVHAHAVSAIIRARKVSGVSGGSQDAG